MNRNTLSIVIAASLVTVLGQLGAQVTLDFATAGKFKRQVFTVTNLDTETTVELPGMNASGSVSNASVGSLESLAIRAQAVADWNLEDALSASGPDGVNDYMKSRTRAKISGKVAGWGVDALTGSGESFLDAEGEAIVIEFMLEGLAAGHKANVRLQGFDMVELEEGDQFTYMIIDSDTGAIIASGTSRKNRDKVKDYVIGDGDMLVIGRATGSFKLGKLTVDVKDSGATENYAAIPEPSMFGVVLVAGVAALVGRRRSCSQGD